MAVGHRVDLYDDREPLVARVTELVTGALDQDGAAIALARSWLLEAVASALSAAGRDVAELRARGRLALIDAERAVSEITAGATVDRARFRTHIGDAVQLACGVAREAPVHIYGEAVDLLWERGQADAVVELEKLWTELGREHRFLLVCGYDLHRFRNSDLPALETFCGLHDPSTNLAALQQRARSLESEVLRRERLEDLMRMLLGVSADLSAARTEPEIARLAVEEGRTAVGAVSSTMWLRSGDHMHVVAHSARVPGELDGYRTIPMALDAPLPIVARTGEPIFIGSFAEYERRFPVSWARVAHMMTGDHALAMLPLTGTHEPLGVICFTYDQPRTFEAPDQAFKAILARQCALAIENVRLQDAERAGRVEAELLYQLTASVNALHDLDAIYKLAIDTALRASASQRAAILVFDTGGVMRFKAWHGLSETYRHAVEGHSPWKPDAQNPTPVTVDDTETDPAWASYRDVFRAEGVRALAFVPLVHQRRLIGKLMLYRDEPRGFSVRELQMTGAIAIHVAQAIERKRGERELARAYREERDAHHEANEATRAREEILSVVSHDLRNPLGTIMLAASTLLAIDAGEKAHRVRTIAERVHRQAERMARLIEDLVDFAGIQAGRLAMRRALHAPEAIVNEARDLFGPIAEERGLAFEAKLPAGLPQVDCDSERVVQLISNLVSNALKVTPKGGTIAIGAEPKDREIVFFVRDTGPGIDPEDLPNVFERFWRSKGANYKGAGLGLSIARGIVDAHGGRIWAESQVGVGSTFYFSLYSQQN